MSRKNKGPDSSFSLEPNELKILCDDTHNAWLSLGKAGYERKPVEEANLTFRRSIYAVKDIKKGESFSKENVRRIRPGFGLAPKYWEDVLSKKSNQTIERVTPISWNIVE